MIGLPGIPKFVLRLMAVLALCSAWQSGSGRVVTEALPEHCGDIDWHVRSRFAKGVCEMTLQWDYVDSLNYSEASVWLDVGAAWSALDPVQCRLIYNKVQHGSVVGRSSTNYVFEGMAADNGVSLRLLRNSTGAVVELGTRMAVGSVPVDCDGVGQLRIVVPDKIELLRNNLVAEALDPVAYIGFDSADSLAAYMKASTDPAEKYWKYLDRDTKAGKMIVNTDYRLASVKWGDGYALIDLSKPGFPVKAWLLPTPYIDHYDLVWYDANGRRLDCDASADITDGTTLTLNLPLYGGTVRFRRVLPREGAE